MAEVSTGNVVRLNSGGPAMTVGQLVVASVWTCQWFHGTELRSGEFHQDSLTLADAGEDPGAED
jgi:uncharacterized protein YodC (DUF2158 family)